MQIDKAHYEVVSEEILRPAIAAAREGTSKHLDFDKGGLQGGQQIVFRSCKSLPLAAVMALYQKTDSRAAERSIRAGMSRYTFA